MRHLCAASFAALFLFALPLAADQITLTSPSGGLEIEGDYLGFDGRFIRVESIYGELTLDYTVMDCAGADCPDPESFVPEIRLSGAGRIGRLLLPALIEAFAREEGLGLERVEEAPARFSYMLSDAERQVVRFSFLISNTDEGFADILANEADIAMTVREVRAQERERALAIGRGDLADARRSVIVALDGMVPIVAPGQRVSAISLGDLARVFSGEVTNWSEIGGADGAIELHLRDARSGLAQGFEDRVMRGVDLASGVIRHADDRGLSEAVLSNPNALGLTASEALGDAEPLDIIGPCGLGGPASEARIRSEDYPLTVPLFLYVPLQRLPEPGRDFLTYVQSAEAQRVIRRAGFVDLAGVEIPMAEQGERLVTAILNAGDDIPLEELQGMIRALAGMDRLSTTFRFEEGAVRLDAQSRANARELAQALRDGRYRGARILFVGFSDGLGPAAANQVLSLERADAVLAQVQGILGEASTGATLATLGFGEALPMGCDTTEWGREINRRVEVWIGPLAN